jgi:hypothetical protein
VQSLGARRFEAGPLAGGEDDGGETGSLHGTARAIFGPLGYSTVTDFAKFLG